MAAQHSLAESASVGLLGRRGQWPLIIGFLVLMAVGIATVWLVITSRAQNQWVAHTFEVQTRTTSLLNALQQAETAQRGYLLVGGDIYARTYRSGRDATLRNLAEIRKLTTDNAEQQRRIDAVEPIVAARLADLEQIMTFAESDRLIDAVARVRSNEGKRLMDDVRRRLGAILRVEARLLDQRSTRARNSAYALLGVTLVGLSLIVLIAFLAYRSLRRYTQAIVAASDELKVLNTDLEGRVAERTADLTAANEEIQRYAYIVSHDLRAPLVNVMGYTSELEQAGKIIERGVAEAEAEREVSADIVTAVREDMPEALGFIRASTEKMDRLINAILRLSREGRRNLLPETLDMTAMARNIADSVHHQTEAAGAQILVEALPSIESDRLSMEQILGNLIDNAVKYLDAGRPGEIVISGEDLPGGWVVYRVADNGRGIAARDHERIFELFRRSGKQDRRGEGLGLAFVRNSVRRIGGTIDIESELGKGSTFLLKFPKRLILSEPGGVL